MIHSVVGRRWNVTFETDLFVIEVFALDYLHFHVRIDFILLRHFLNKLLMKHIFDGLEAFVFDSFYLLDNFIVAWNLGPVVQRVVRKYECFYLHNFFIYSDI